MRDDPLVRMPADCPQVVCNDRRHRRAAQSDLLFYRLSIRTSRAARNSQAGCPPPGPPAEHTTLGHAPPLVPYPPGPSVHCPLRSQSHHGQNDGSFFFFFFFPLRLTTLPALRCLSFMVALKRFPIIFFVFDLDCLKKLIRHMFPMFFIQRSPECFLTI